MQQQQIGWLFVCVFGRLSFLLNAPGLQGEGGRGLVTDPEEELCKRTRAKQNKNKHHGW